MDIKNINSKLISTKATSFVISENCPYLCKHCLRKDRRPNNLSRDVIDATLDQLLITGILHLTGGEPLTRDKIVSYLLSEINRLNNKPREIQVITNASVCFRKFEKFVEALGTNIGLLNLIISNDYYHSLERKRLNGGRDNIHEMAKGYNEILVNYGLNRDKDDYLWMIEDYKDYKDGKGCVSIGRGEDIPGSRYIHRSFIFEDNLCLVGNMIVTDIQINYDGLITPRGDFSWEEKDYYYGSEKNILKYPLKKIIPRGESKCNRGLMFY